ncbi:hypothetical protein WT22_00950 [Burkholderia territorii]|nr:hypothetical protein WT22_00950 [Burkholderia territorii]KWA42261.1 hypothetical protein WT40_02030 [Burkholderia territorii]
MFQIQRRGDFSDFHFDRYHILIDAAFNLRSTGSPLCKCLFRLKLLTCLFAQRLADECQWKLVY